MSQQRTQPRRRNRAWIVLKWTAFSLMLVSVGLSVTFMALTWQPFTPPDPADRSPTVVYSADGQVMARLYEEYRIPVALSDVPKHTITAVLAAEDTRFYSHHGVDIHGIGRALWANVRAGAIVQGGSTITQQLVRLEVTGNERTLRRKLDEAVLAVRTERALTKNAILIRYLNGVYFGDGAYGVEAAAQRFFGKHVWDLTPAEGALLAGLIRGPGDGNPRGNPALARRRQREILRTEQEQGWLTAAQTAKALAAPLQLAPKHRDPWRAPYVVEMVRQYLVRTYGRDAVYGGGLRVHTSINLDWQAAAQEALDAGVAEGSGQGVQNGALVSIEPGTGYIRALVGGTNFYRSNFNRATQAHRQPGSSFKTFVYLAAIQQGHTWGETWEDAPVQIGAWTPGNYGDRYRGIVTLADALAFSLNSVAVRLTAAVGPTSVISAARAAGIKSPLEPNLSLALGAYEVTPLEMASAFSTLAAHGVYAPPRLVMRVTQDGKVLEQAVPTVKQTIDPAHAARLIEGLQGVIDHGTGRGANIGRPEAGKTGTSNEYRDAWFIGFTPQLSTAVWMGRDDHSPMSVVTGGSYPARAWARYMRRALDGQPALPFLGG